MSVDDEPDNNSNSPYTPQIATAADMYGIGAEIIGRRSFNGFHKVVGDTWEEAYQKTMGAAKDTTKDAVSDDELLRRYEQYVKGR
eukprot:1401603-Ditylum_brightwellii.AAC.1